MTLATLKEIARDLVARAGQIDAKAEVFASAVSGRSAFTRYAMGDITTSGDVDSGKMSITVAIGKRHATASSNRSEPEAMGELVARAFAMARLSPEDPEWMPVLGAQSASPAGPTYDEATAMLGPEAGGEAAKKAIAVTRGTDLLAAGFYKIDSSERAFASSAGLSAAHRVAIARFSTTVRTADGTGSGWAAGESGKASELDVAKLASIAAEKASASKSPTELDPGRYTVVLEPACVSLLMQYFVEALDQRQADEGRSFFTKPGGGTRVGETLFTKGISFSSDPFDPATPSAPFDDEGLPLSRIAWISDGRLEALRRSRYWAKEKGGTPTGDHSAFQLSGTAGKTREALIAGVERGLLVTRFWYVRWLDRKTMTLTGLTRDGVFLIEKGKIVRPVNNFRWNDSPARVLANLSGWSADTTRVPGWSIDEVLRVPTIVARDFLMASKSAAV